MLHKLLGLSRGCGSSILAPLCSSSGLICSLVLYSVQGAGVDHLPQQLMQGELKVESQGPSSVGPPLH